ncbi:DUF397 domain-containing protein [Saccharothrix xinjiangensis]|uniref:DUF397 domain-containing protein n=1 Tax=Saccharothrix xinjiangensis TaxID=204798 RepID=A0ABV9XQH1_9PSEU
MRQRTRWRKSSYSEGVGTNCVEVAWHKSSYSGDVGSDCVQVASASEAVGVRDSKNTTPQLAFTPAAWRAFLANL